jgi:hypothetical protein
MLRTFMRSKIHRATVTGNELNYVGSLTLSPALVEAADIGPHEFVHVVTPTGKSVGATDDRSPPLWLAVAMNAGRQPEATATAGHGPAWSCPAARAEHSRAAPEISSHGGG